MENTKLILNIPYDMHLKLVNASKERGQTKASIIRLALYDFFKKHETENDRTRINPEN
jgi:hypothetical protein